MWHTSQSSERLINLHRGSLYGAQLKWLSGSTWDLIGFTKKLLSRFYRQRRFKAFLFLKVYKVIKCIRDGIREATCPRLYSEIAHQPNAGFSFYCLVPKNRVQS